MHRKRSYRLAQQHNLCLYKSEVYNYKRGHWIGKELKLRQFAPTSPLWPRNGRVMLNWGCSVVPEWNDNVSWINNPEAVIGAVDKLRTFLILGEFNVPTLKHTNNKTDAQQWVDNGRAVFVRHKLNGHSGQGIELITNGTVPEAPLYTRNFPKSHEYRVHVFRGEILDLVEKKATSLEANRKVRTHDNGWVFAHSELTCDRLEYRHVLETTARNAIDALSLDFGAVDILVRHRDDDYHSLAVCEINTAPNITAPTTKQRYLDKIKEFL